MICRESDPTIDLHCPNEAWFRSPPGVPDSERIGRDTLNDHKRHLFNLYYIIRFLKVKLRSCLIVTLFMLFLPVPFEKVNARGGKQESAFSLTKGVRAFSLTNREGAFSLTWRL